MIALRYATASQEIPLGYFLDSTDGNSEETGLTIANTDIKLWKTGASSLANKNSGGATHISNGIYYATLDATDTNTLGPLVIFVHVSGALPVRLECTVYPAAVYDAMIAGTDYLPVDAVQIEGADATDTMDARLAAYDAVVPADLPANFADLAITASTGRVTVGTNNDKTGYSISGTKTTLDALNDVSSGDVQTAAAAALAAYDPPTKAELDAGLGALNDFDPATQTVDVGKINGSAASASNLQKSASTIVQGTAVAGTLSTTQMSTDLTEATDDHYNGRIIIWTSGVLQNQATDITAYNGTTKVVTYTACTEPPSADDTFVIV